MNTLCVRSPILVLGIGNVLLRDEGIGVHIIEEMKKNDLPDNVELVDGGTGGADLLDVIAERQKVIVIDAVQGDYKPGTLIRFTAEDLVKLDGTEVSLHELGLYETLLMAKMLGCEPKEVIIIGIKPKEIKWGLELSEEIKPLVPKIIDIVLKEIET